MFNSVLILDKPEYLARTDNLVSDMARNNTAREVLATPRGRRIDRYGGWHTPKKGGFGGPPDNFELKDA